MDLDDGRVTFGDPVAESHTQVKDPVCGAVMVRADAAAAIDYRGSLYYFCSAVCKERFSVEPERYLAAGDAAT